MRSLCGSCPLAERLLRALPVRWAHTLLLSGNPDSHVALARQACASDTAADGDGYGDSPERTCDGNGLCTHAGAAQPRTSGGSCPHGGRWFVAALNGRSSALELPLALHSALCGVNSTRRIVLTVLSDAHAAAATSATSNGSSCHLLVEGRLQIECEAAGQAVSSALVVPPFSGWIAFEE